MEDKIDNELAKAIDMIKRGTSVFRFRPMSSQLRRYIHRAAQGNEYVQTASEGEGKWRKVTLRPTQKALEEAQQGVAPADFVPGVIGEDVSDPVATEQPAEDQTDETPTQKMATQTIAATVTETVVETPTHVVEEHSVVVTTDTETK